MWPWCLCQRSVDRLWNFALKVITLLHNSLHQLHFKPRVIFVGSWVWQPHQELLQGKPVQTQHLFLLPSLIPIFSWITVNQIPKSNTTRYFWQQCQISMKVISTFSENLSRKGISKALRALPSSIKFYILSGVFLTSYLINEFHE